MLKNLLIKNYRLFRNLEISNLRQVNLIAGTNNAGKTALLEAIRIYANNCSQTIIGNIVLQRSALNESRLYESFKSVCYKETDEFFINEKVCKFNVLKNGELQVVVNNIVRVGSNLFNLADYQNPIDKTMFIPFYAKNEIKMRNEWWENIIFSDEEQAKVIELLNLITPIKIKRISIYEEVPVFLLETGEKVKMSSWGDGARRLLMIGLALVNAKNSFLLIDEFEVGLHFSIQEKIWNIIFNYAQKNNIQAFITTHSYDAIKSFSYSMANYERVGQYLRLQRSRVTNEVEAIIYSQKTLDISIDNQFETR